jgi:subtilisin family serine protease
MTVHPATTSAVWPESSDWCRALIGLTALMERTAGVESVRVALIDGPVAIDHPDLASGNVRVLSGTATCRQHSGMACTHGTFVAGVLHARRECRIPGICPGCTLLVRPIFAETVTVSKRDGLPAATLADVAAAILEAIDAGARVINLSVGLADQGPGSERAVEQALDAAAQHGVIIVAAAGNQGVIGGSIITRHPWVTPVVACNSSGRVMALSNLGASIGRRGLAAPGENIESLAATGGTAKFSGTSAAVPSVTGTFALLWSAFPAANATHLRLAVMGSDRRRSVTPPLLDAEAAYQTLAAVFIGGQQQ